MPECEVCGRSIGIPFAKEQVIVSKNGSNDQAQWTFAHVSCLDAAFVDRLQSAIDNPELRTESLDRFLRSLVMDPNYFANLVDRVKGEEPGILRMLAGYAFDAQASPGRAFARKVLSAAWYTEETRH